MKLKRFNTLNEEITIGGQSLEKYFKSLENSLNKMYSPKVDVITINFSYNNDIDKFIVHIMLKLPNSYKRLKEFIKISEELFELFDIGDDDVDVDSSPNRFVGNKPLTWFRENEEKLSYLIDSNELGLL